MLASTSGVVLDYLQTFVWPAVTVGLVLFFLIRFRHNVANLLDRMTEVRGPGVGLSALPPSQEQADDDAVVPLGAFVDMVDDYEEQLQDAQQQQQENVEQLIQRAVIAELELDFERTYRLIFESQIRALRALRDIQPGSAPRSLLEPIFLGATPPLTSFTFEQWVSFLLKPGYGGDALVEQLGDGSYRITRKGLAFLAYIERNQLPPKIF